MTLPLIDPTLFALWQADATGLLTATCSIVRQTVTPDGAGGSTISFATTATNVPCATVALEGQETDQEGRLTSVVTYRISVPAGTQIAEGDQIQIGQNIYEVQAIRADPTSLYLVLPLLCKLVS